MNVLTYAPCLFKKKTRRTDDQLHSVANLFHCTLFSISGRNCVFVTDAENNLTLFFKSYFVRGEERYAKGKAKTRDEERNGKIVKSDFLPRPVFFLGAKHVKLCM